LYGRHGFTQYQLVLPKAAGLAGMTDIMRKITTSGRGSFLSVLKVCGPHNQNYLSFPIEGYSLALDFKITSGVWALLAALDAIVLAYGGRVYADVINLTLAQKAVKAGADGLACVCAGAGGHTGFLSPFAFVSAIREFFDGEIILGGGVTDGAGIAGAIAAGADYVYMGTRFIPAHESMAPPEYKDMILSSNIDDLVISAGVTGTPASWLKPSLKQNGFDPDNMPDAPARHYDSSTEFSGKKWLDVWAAGQGLGTIRSRQSVAEIVHQLTNEFDAAMRRINQFTYASRTTT
jgi:nitronate monooxygenase